MIRFKRIQQRFTVFMLIPVTVLLISAGYLGFIYARNSIFSQWRKAAILELQQETHWVDMRLARPKQWISMLIQTSGSRHGGHHIQNWIVEQLKKEPGVVSVNIDIAQNSADPMPMKGNMHGMNTRMNPMDMMNDRMMFHNRDITDIRPPRYNPSVAHETVTLVSEIKSESGQPVGKIEVVIRFEYLFEGIMDSELWQNPRIFLVDYAGNIIYRPETEVPSNIPDPGDSLESEVLNAVISMTYGTIIGPGHPPSKVTGFYRLMQAPWTLVVMSPGAKILSPMMRFGLYYIVGAAIFIFLIVMLIRWVTGHTVAPIREVSKAAQKVAQGDFGETLAVKRQDEVGELTRSFNTMVSQLEERIRLKEAVDLAMEVQQNLLPNNSLKIKNLDIAGQSIYCDETGGDYYDFLQFTEIGENRVGIAVGDVVGHGVAAALLMASVRAFLRSRMMQPGSLADKIGDVNRLLCMDTDNTGNFMTLFTLLIDSTAKQADWVRAGHDPAIVYNPSTDGFEELAGKGVALGVAGDWQFDEYRYVYSENRTVLIGTDGVWETENPAKEKFGKHRLKEILRANHQKSAEEIVQTITAAIVEFRQTERQRDDVTFVVVKFL